MWKCPECGAEISTMKYSAQTTGNEWGTISLPNKRREQDQIENYSDTNFDDSENTDWGPYKYTCNECEEIVNLSNLIWVEEEEEEKGEEEKEIEEEKHDIIYPKNNIIEEQNGILEKMLICDVCKTTYPLSNYSNQHQECPKCGKIIKIEEFKRLLDKGFYNKNE